MLNGEDTALTLALLAALAIAAVAVVAYKKSQPSGGVSQGLISNGWYLYTRDGCGFCSKQLDVLGNVYKISGNVINCSAKPRLLPLGIPRCDDRMIKGFPFWYCRTTREVRTGLQDHIQLRQMAGISS